MEQGTCIEEEGARGTSSWAPASDSGRFSRGFYSCELPHAHFHFIVRSLTHHCAMVWRPRAEYRVRRGREEWEGENWPKWGWKRGNPEWMLEHVGREEGAYWDFENDVSHVPASLPSTIHPLFCSQKKKIIIN